MERDKKKAPRIVRRDLDVEPLTPEESALQVKVAQAARKKLALEHRSLGVNGWLAPGPSDNTTYPHYAIEHLRTTPKELWDDPDMNHQPEPPAEW